MKAHVDFLKNEVIKNLHSNVCFLSYEKANGDIVNRWGFLKEIDKSSKNTSKRKIGDEYVCYFDVEKRGIHTFCIYNLKDFAPLCDVKLQDVFEDKLAVNGDNTLTYNNVIVKNVYSVRSVFNGLNDLSLSDISIDQLKNYFHQYDEMNESNDCNKFVARVNEFVSDIKDYNERTTTTSNAKVNNWCTNTTSPQSQDEFDKILKMCKENAVAMLKYSSLSNFLNNITSYTTKPDTRFDETNDVFLALLTMKLNSSYSSYKDLNQLEFVKYVKDCLDDTLWCYSDIQHDTLCDCFKIRLLKENDFKVEWLVGFDTVAESWYSRATCYMNEDMTIRSLFTK